MGGFNDNEDASDVVPGAGTWGGSLADPPEHLDAGEAPSAGRLDAAGGGSDEVKDVEAAPAPAEVQDEGTQEPPPLPQSDDPNAPGYVAPQSTDPSAPGYVAPAQ